MSDRGQFRVRSVMIVVSPLRSDTFLPLYAPICDCHQETLSALTALLIIHSCTLQCVLMTQDLMTPFLSVSKILNPGWKRTVNCLTRTKHRFWLQVSEVRERISTPILKNWLARNSSSFSFSRTPLPGC